MALINLYWIWTILLWTPYIPRRIFFGGRSKSKVWRANVFSFTRW